MNSTTEICAKAEAIISKVLRLQRIERDKNFFELGGDSLAAMTIAAELEAEVGIDVPLRIFFDAATIQDLYDAFIRIGIGRSTP